MSNDIILFLYTRLPDYFYRCVQHFTATYKYKAVIVRYRSDVNTKYSFAEDQNIRLVYKDQIDLLAFVTDIRPVAIVLSGWSDKAYTRLAERYVKKMPVALAIDNPWTGSIKQKALAAASSLVVHRFCNCVWVPGSSQFEYAKRLGFKNNKIFRELYCADTERFYNLPTHRIGEREREYPKRMVFVGRLVEYKQPHILAKVFSQLVTERSYSWKLIIAGEGPLKETIRKHNYEHVQVLDFLDPSTLPEFYAGSGAFCLPSRGEHWGVAVHEAAAAGLPLLLSDTVDSAYKFLIDEFNGYSFNTDDERSLKSALARFFELNDDGLKDMSANSVYLSKRIHHQSWSAILNSIIKRTDE